MELPVLLDRDLHLYEVAKSDEELFQALRGEIGKLIRFLFAAIADATWSEKHPLFLEKALHLVVRRYASDRLPKEWSHSLAKLLRLYHRSLSDFLPKDLVVEWVRSDGSSEEVEVNSLLFATESPYLEELLQVEGGGRHRRRFRVETDLSSSFWHSYLAFCESGELPDLWRLSREELLAYIEASHRCSCLPLEEGAVATYMRFVDRSNLFDELIYAHQRSLLPLRRSCMEYGNREIGDQFLFEELENLEEIAIDLKSSSPLTERLLEPIEEWITSLRLAPHLEGAPLVVRLLERCRHLRLLDVSNFRRGEQLLELFECWVEERRVGNRQVGMELEGVLLGECDWLDATYLRRILLCFPRLRRLGLRGNAQLNYRSWALLADFTGLEELDLSSCYLFSDEEMQLLFSLLPRLTVLRLAGCIRLSERMLIEMIHRAKGLRELDLSGCQVGQPLLVELLTRPSSLRVLWLRHCLQLRSAQIVTVLKKAFWLERLLLSEGVLTEEARRELGSLRLQVEEG